MKLPSLLLFLFFSFLRFVRTSNETSATICVEEGSACRTSRNDERTNDRCHSRATNLTNKNVRTNESRGHEGLSYRGRKQEGGKVERSEQEESEKAKKLRDRELQKASAWIVKGFGVKRRDGEGVTGRRRWRETTRKGNAYFYSAGEFTIQVQKIQ